MFFLLPANLEEIFITSISVGETKWSDADPLSVSLGSFCCLVWLLNFFLILLPFTKTQNTVIQPVFRWFFSWTWEKLTISGVSRSTTKQTLSFIGGNRLVNDVSPDKVLKKAGGPKESPWSNLPYWRPAWCEARYHVQKAAAERGCLKYGRGNWIE